MMPSPMTRNATWAIAIAALCFAACAGPPSGPFMEPFPTDWEKIPRAMFPPELDVQPRWLGWTVPEDAPTVFGEREPVASLSDPEREVTAHLERLVREATDSDATASEPAGFVVGSITRQTRCSAQAILASRSADNDTGLSWAPFESMILGRCGLGHGPISRGLTVTLSADRVESEGFDAWLASRLARHAHETIRRALPREETSQAGDDAARSTAASTPLDWGIAWSVHPTDTGYLLRTVAVVVPNHLNRVRIDPFPMASMDGRFVIEGTLYREAKGTRATLVPLDGGRTRTCVDDHANASPGRFRLVCILPADTDLAVLDIVHFVQGRAGWRSFQQADRIPLARGQQPPRRWGVEPPDIDPPLDADPRDRVLVWLNGLLDREGAPTVPVLPPMHEVSHMRDNDSSEVNPGYFLRERWISPVPRGAFFFRSRGAAHTRTDPWMVAVSLRYDAAFARMQLGTPPLVGVMLSRPEDCDPSEATCLRVSYDLIQRMEIPEAGDVSAAVRAQIDEWRAAIGLAPLAHASATVQRRLNQQRQRFQRPGASRHLAVGNTDQRWGAHMPRSPGDHPELWAWWVSGPSSLVLPPELLAPEPPRVAISSTRECNAWTNACHDLILIGIQR